MNILFFQHKINTLIIKYLKYILPTHKPKVINNFVTFVLLSLLSPWQMALAQNPQLTRDSSAFTAKEVHIVAVGDIMLGTAYPSKKYLPPNYDCFPLLESVKPFIKKADISFANLEGALSNGGKMSKKCTDTLKCYAFRMPEQYGLCLADAGFDILSLANNHSGDFGDYGRKRTMHILDSLQIAYAGLELSPTAEFTKDSIRYGFVAFAPNKGTLDLLKTEEAIRLVKDLASRNDIVIVSFHGGAEGKDYQHLPKTEETFYGENRGNVYAFAHQMIDAGADMVFGHGPHVTRAMEIYNNRFIAYSLGNFATYGRFNLSGPNGITPLVNIYTDTEGRFLHGQIISVLQSGEGGAQLDSNHRVIGIINKLNQSDLPENRLIIDKNGRF